ncbi:MAG: UMP kinase [Elusimicrobiales bacterium]
MPRRVLLKLSGESLQNGTERGIDARALVHIAEEIAPVCGRVQLAVVIGGGNLWRGAKDGAGMIDRVTSDNMGMMATMMNAMALQAALEKLGVPTRVQAALQVMQLAEPFIRRRAVRHLEKGRVVIFAGGTGNPYFTTDTAAALRASEIEANALLKATQVDGVYTADPKKDPSATPLAEVSYMDAISRNLKFMDAAALSLCMENRIPITVFNLHKDGSILKAVMGERVGTLIS